MSGRERIAFLGQASGCFPENVKFGRGIRKRTIPRNGILQNYIGEERAERQGDQRDGSAFSCFAEEKHNKSGKNKNQTEIPAQRDPFENGR